MTKIIRILYLSHHYIKTIQAFIKRLKQITTIPEVQLINGWQTPLNEYRDGIFITDENCVKDLWKKGEITEVILSKDDGIPAIYNCGP